MIVNLLSHVRIRNTIIAALLAMVVVVVINLSGVGTSSFILSLNTLITVVIAGLATAFCWYYRSLLHPADPIEKIWRNLGIGLGLWTIAEVIWSILTLIGDEIPYPSVGDGLWVTGYLFFILSFISLYHLLQIRSSTTTIAVALGSAVIYIGVVASYVIMPIVQDPESAWLEKILGAFYPIGDLVVAFSALLLALALMGGAFSWVWVFIAGGFLSLSFSDTLFTFADWNGLYFPDGSSNMLSVVVDMTYVLGYVLVAIGIFSQIEFTVSDVKEPLVVRYRSLLDEQDDTLKTVTITFFTDAENRLISASPTVAYLQPPERRMQDLDGVPFHQATGLDVEFTRRLFQDLMEHGSVSNRSSTVLLEDHQPARAYLSGVSIFNVANRYIGSDITMTIRIRPDTFSGGPALDGLTATAKEAGSTEGISEERLVSQFFVGKIHALYVVVFRFGGSKAARSMQRTFNASANHLNAGVQMEGSSLIFTSETHDLPRYRELLQRAMNYAVAIASLDVVKRDIGKIEDGLDPALIQAGKDAGLYGLNLEPQGSGMAK